MPRKTRVLVAVGGFPPALNYGGPAVSLDNLCRALGREGSLDCAVVTRDHDLGETARLPGIGAGWNARDGFRVLYLRESELNLFRLREVVREVAPDVIYLNSLFGAAFTVPLLKIAREASIPVLLAPRGELCANAFKKKYKKIPYLFFLRPFLRGDSVFYHSTSDEEFECIREVVRPLKENVFQITETPTFPPEGLPRKSKKDGKLSCIFLSRIHPKKNLLGALEALASVRGEITFDIYGPIEDAAYWARCEAAIAALPPNVRATYRGVVQRAAIHETFARHDAFLFPTFSENYGHVIPEAMLSGCPVVTSDQTPWTDLNEAEAGWALPLADRGAFTAALQSLADMDDAAHAALVARMQRYLDHKLRIPETVQAYVECFETIASSAR